MTLRPLAVLGAFALLQAGAAAGQPCAWQPAPNLSSLPAWGFGLAFDENAAQTVMFGGQDTSGNWSDDTWVYDGVTWSQLPVAGPPELIMTTLAYDSARGETVLFGGYQHTPGEPEYGVTWTWNGSAWEEHPVPGPSARAYHATAFDAARAEVVLFGGIVGSGDLNDTWVWNGSGWTQRTPATSPIPRDGAKMVYDAARQQIVLFGGFGYPEPDASLGDTWVWNGVTWTRLDIPGPPARAYHGMSYDSHRQTVLLWGGYSESGDFNDTWEFDGTQWTQLQLDGPEPFNISYEMVYDSARRRHVLRGRELGASVTWELARTEISVTTPPAHSFTPVGVPVSLHVGLIDEGGLAFQWFRNGAPLSDGPGISGAASATLTLGAPAHSDSGAYSVRVTGGCGSVVLVAALGVMCPGDASGDGETDFVDLNLVISNYNAPCVP